MDAIIRGTTPTIKFDFKTIDPADIETAYLVVKQLGDIRIKLPIDSATASTASVSWTLSQEQTLGLTPGKNITIVCDWRLQNGLRGRSEEAVYRADNPGVNEVI